MPDVEVWEISALRNSASACHVFLLDNMYIVFFKSGCLTQIPAIKQLIKLFSW